MKVKELIDELSLFSGAGDDEVIVYDSDGNYYNIYGACIDDAPALIFAIKIDKAVE